MSVHWRMTSVVPYSLPASYSYRFGISWYQQHHCSRPASTATVHNLSAYQRLLQYTTAAAGRQHCHRMPLPSALPAVRQRHKANLKERSNTFLCLDVLGFCHFADILSYRIQDGKHISEVRPCNSPCLSELQYPSCNLQAIPLQIPPSPEDPCVIIHELICVFLAPLLYFRPEDDFHDLCVTIHDPNGPVWLQYTGRGLQWVTFVLSWAQLAFYGYQSLRTTLGWEETYVCVIEGRLMLN